MLMSPDDLDALEDTLDLLSDSAAAEARTARKDISKGKG